MQQNGLGGPNPPGSNSAGLGAAWAVVGAAPHPTLQPWGVSRDRGMNAASPHQWGECPQGSPQSHGDLPGTLSQVALRGPMKSLGAGKDPKKPCNPPHPRHPHCPPHANPPGPSPKPQCQPTSSQPPPPAPQAPLGMVLGPSRKGNSSHPHLCLAPRGPTGNCPTVGH